MDIAETPKTFLPSTYQKDCTNPIEYQSDTKVVFVSNNVPSKITIKELRERCKSKGLPSYGTKDELLTRLESIPE